MGYLSIDNLYKNRDVLLFRECWALEKVHGSSAHIRLTRIADYLGGVQITYFAGGEKHERFKAIFDESKLREAFLASGLTALTIYGEVYGGKCQGMKDTYGEELRFIAFDVMVGETWLAVPQAVEIVESFGLEFVPFEKGPTDLAWLDQQRDLPSRIAKRRGILEDKQSEGIVIRTPIEVRKNNGQRIIAKHKTAGFRETKTPRQVDDAVLAVLSEADKIAEEWVTPMRLQHILQKITPTGTAWDFCDIAPVSTAMLADIQKESVGEIVWSKEAEKAIRRKTAELFKTQVIQVVQKVV